MKKIILILLALSAVVAAVMLNRSQPEDTIKTRPADVKVEAAALVAEFQADEAGANEKYLNKTLEVTGTVSTFQRDDQGNFSVTLSAGSQATGVKCKFDKLAEHRRREFQIGEKVTFKGVCMGYIGDVQLVGCVEVD